MGIPHKHAEVIKAWADGAEIQIKLNDGSWISIEFPFWNPSETYRIKPPKKTPGQVYFEGAYPKIDWLDRGMYNKNNYEQGAKAVIEAYKRGEFDEDCNC